MTYSCINIQHGIPTPDEEPTEVKEMRKAITRERMRSALIHRVCGWAEAKGLKGEDYMTLLAYQALRQLEEMHVKYMRLMDLTARPPLIVPAERAPSGQEAK